MADWDTRALHREACDAFTTAYHVAEKGKKLLDEITEIDRLLKKMDALEEVCVCSCNDSRWRPPLTTDQVKAFVRSKLEARRDELRHEFNNFGKK